MSKTNRDFVSVVNNTLNSNNNDMFISPKFILSVGRDVLSDFLKKDSESRRITTLSEGWSELECLPMVEVPVTECSDLDIKLCTKLMRTKDKLPETFSGYYGNLIKQVASINFGQFYDFIRSPRLWKDIQNRPFKDNRIKYYFFINGYIYIPNSDVENIRVEALFKYKWEVDIVNTKNCPTCKETCVKPLDYEFVSPDYLLNSVQTETINKILTKFKINPDNKIDLNEYNKTQGK
jgi:hypothetical protein